MNTEQYMNYLHEMGNLSADIRCGNLLAVCPTHEVYMNIFGVTISMRGGPKIAYGSFKELGEWAQLLLVPNATMTFEEWCNRDNRPYGP